MREVWFVILAKTVCHRIIKSLIPASCVPETAVLRLVSAVCASRLAAETQVSLHHCVLHGDIAVAHCTCYCDEGCPKCFRPHVKKQYWMVGRGGLVVEHPPAV